MRAALLVVLVACGDDRQVLEVYEPASGTRLKLEQYLFEDGTRQVAPGGYYDIQRHARCTQRTWSDDVARCVPDAEPALFLDATCEQAFGAAVTDQHPTHFVAGGNARMWEADEKITIPNAAYAVIDGTCRQVSAPDAPAFWSVGQEIVGEDMAEIVTTEITGDERLGLVVLSSSDGMELPTTFRDREVGTDCTPAPHADGSACVPDVPLASVFADRDCTQPAVISHDGTGVVATTDARGCPRLHAVDPAPLPNAFRRDVTGACEAIGTQSAHALAQSVELVPLERSVERSPHRLRRIVASGGAWSIYADRFYDSATRAECSLVRYGEMLRCLPTALAPVVRAFSDARCTQSLLVARVPDASCEPVQFAVLGLGSGLTEEVYAIGAPVTAYDLDGQGSCQPVARPGSTPHALGAVLPPTTFVGATPFGVR